MKYRVRIWCNDCYHSDYAGCFGGEADYILDDNDQPFTTFEAAEEKTWGIMGPWDYAFQRSEDGEHWTTIDEDAP